MDIYLATLETHDFLFFVTRELKTGVCERYVNNTALLYAINNFSETNRIVSGTMPHYEEDWNKFSVYATPAKIVNVKEPLKVSYNAVDEALAFKMEDVGTKRAIPKYGAYYKFPPKTEFRFYTIGGKGPRVIRVGKKGCVCRASYQKLEVEKSKRGKFKPSHPINPRHMPKDFVLIDGDEIPIPPIRIFDNVVAEGEHIIASDGNNRHVIAIPDKALFRRVFDDRNRFA
jgi:CRISPR type I-D-associated protein Csc1